MPDILIFNSLDYLKKERLHLTLLCHHHYILCDGCDVMPFIHMHARVWRNLCKPINLIQSEVVSASAQNRVHAIAYMCVLKNVMSGPLQFCVFMYSRREKQVDWGHEADLHNVPHLNPFNVSNFPYRDPTPGLRLFTDFLRSLDYMDYSLWKRVVT